MLRQTHCSPALRPLFSVSSYKLPHRASSRRRPLFAALLEFCHALFVAAGADKRRILALSDHLHALMADRASRIRRAGNRLAVAALSILADEQFCVLSIHRKQPFSAVRALLVRQVVVAERSLFRLDLIDQFHRVAADLLHKHIAPLLSLCNVV